MGATRHGGFRKERGIVQYTPTPMERQDRTPVTIERHRLTVERGIRLEPERPWAGDLPDLPEPIQIAARGPLGYVGALRISVRDPGARPLRIVDPPAITFGPKSDVEPVLAEVLRQELDDEQRIWRELYGHHYVNPPD